MTDYQALNAQLAALIHGIPHRIANLANAAALLYHTLDGLNWAGFYLLENDTLVLGPFQDKPGHLQRISVILVHALGHHPDTQPEAQHKAFTSRDTVDILLCADHFFEDRLFTFIELLHELPLTLGNFADGLPQT